MDAQKLDLFKQKAIESGYSPDDINAFLSSVNPSTPSSEQSTYDPTGKTFAQMMAETGQQSTLDEMGKKGILPSPQPQDTVQSNPSFTSQPSASRQESSPAFQPIDTKSVEFSKDIPQVTQPFGNRSSIEKFSGGVNLGADFRVTTGTPLAAPSGEWKVVTASPGFNQGSGNIAKIQNTKTGETLGFEHLSNIGVKPGEVITGGTVIGLSGGDQGGSGMGNSTGAHASIPYQDAQGRYQDVLKTPYIAEVFTPKQPAPAALPAQETPATPIVPATQETPAPLPTPIESASAVVPSAQIPIDKVLSAVPESQQEAAKTAIPALTQALSEQGITDPKAVSYAIATAGGESGFTPKDEVLAQRGINAHNDRIANFQDNYEGGKDYHGRGYIQLTHKGNYKKYGDKIGVDLVSNPELANDPIVAAKILAVYMKESGAADAAQKGDYQRARVLVNGPGALQAKEIATAAQNYEQFLR